MCMIYEQCNYFMLLLLYDFEMENVEIKQTWNLKLETWNLKPIVSLPHTHALIMNVIFNVGKDALSFCTLLCIQRDLLRKDI